MPGAGGMARVALAALLSGLTEEKYADDCLSTSCTSVTLGLGKVERSLKDGSRVHPTIGMFW
jgi:hypothetical protein